MRCDAHGCPAPPLGSASSTLYGRWGVPRVPYTVACLHQAAPASAHRGFGVNCCSCSSTDRRCPLGPGSVHTSLGRARALSGDGVDAGGSESGVSGRARLSARATAAAAQHTAAGSRTLGPPHHTTQQGRSGGQRAGRARVKRRPPTPCGRSTTAHGRPCSSGYGTAVTRQNRS